MTKPHIIAEQNPNLSFDDLYTQAKESIPELTTFGRNFLDQARERYPGKFDTAFIEIDLKKKQRAQEKIISDYEGRHELITDLARGRIVVHTPEQAELLRQMIKEKKDEYKLEKLKDRFGDDIPKTGYRDVLSLTRLSTGHVAEFRIEHAAMIEAGHASHPYYEKVQEIERRAKNEGNRAYKPEEALELAKNLKEIRTLHKNTSKKAGLDALLTDKGRNILAKQDAQDAYLDTLAPPEAPEGAAGVPVPRGGDYQTLKRYRVVAISANKKPNITQPKKSGHHRKGPGSWS